MNWRRENLSESPRIMIFRLKRLWLVNPDDRPSTEVCAQCGHLNRDHGFNDNREPVCVPKCRCKEFMIDLHKEIKDGRKKSEWRDATDYWIQRLTTLPPLRNFKSYAQKCDANKVWGNMPVDIASAEGVGIMLKDSLKVDRAWLIFGFPKGNVPRFEADITDLTLYPREMQFEIEYDNVIEVLR